MWTDFSVYLSLSKSFKFIWNFELVGMKPHWWFWTYNNAIWADRRWWYLNTNGIDRFERVNWFFGKCWSFRQDNFDVLVAEIGSLKLGSRSRWITIASESNWEIWQKKWKFDWLGMEIWGCQYHRQETALIMLPFSGSICHYSRNRYFIYQE